ncbi:type VII secretion target [Hamadaea tsunoensis]|uniref:type VII secretion target n=1 Tax=Hamadaea tsunoensis TaxID=53368 RepID=UPI0004070534|nr:type VII secretion target [Hamadaea tsunoensis]
MSHIQVKASELTTHSSHVDQTADQVARIRDGAQTVTMGANAYGHLLTFALGWFKDMEQELTDKYSEMVTSLHGDGTNLRTASSGYTSSDDHAKTKTQSVANQHPGIELPL